MDDVDETDEREELFYNNVREKIVRVTLSYSVENTIIFIKLIFLIEFF